MLKRIFDFVAACAGLFVLSPVLLLVALWIKLDSPGPVLFRQKRVGRHGQPFNILKFRTMVVAAEAQGLSITTHADQRITRAGSVLRKCKLDELPQLYNVLAGEMSLVGPRPEVPKYVALYPETARVAILSVRPGITDNASIEFSDESSLLRDSADPERMYVEEILPRKIALYLDYVAAQSFWLDLSLIGKTLSKLMASR